MSQENPSKVSPGAPTPIKPGKLGADKEKEEKKGGNKKKVLKELHPDGKKGLDGKNTKGSKVERLVNDKELKPTKPKTEEQTKTEDKAKLDEKAKVEQKTPGPGPEPKADLLHEPKSENIRSVFELSLLEPKSAYNENEGKNNENVNNPLGMGMQMLRSMWSDLSPGEGIMNNMVKELLELKSKEGALMAFKANDIIAVLEKVKNILISQDSLVKLRAPIKIVGDIHGQFNDLKRIFKANGYPSDTPFLFLGDYVDRGPHSLEVIMLLFCYKALYPKNITLLRGNHECMNTNRVYGFFDELNRRNFGELYPEFNDVFDHLPLTAIVNNKILCMHGGISNLLRSLNELKTMQRPVSMLPPDCPDIAIDLLWADPDKKRSGYHKSARGASYTFGMDALDEFCAHMRVDLIVRAHQVVQRGFERMGLNNKTKLVTVFSAPNYCNEFDNSAAVMIVTEKLSINFNIIEADPSTSKEREQTRAAVPKQDTFPDLDETQKSLTRTSASFKRNVKKD